MLNVPSFFIRLAPALAVVSAVAALCVPSNLRAQNPGRVDVNFNPAAGAATLPDGTPAFAGTVNTILLDGNNVVVGGNFTSAVGAAGTGGQRNFLARYSNAGVLENGFNPTQLGGPDGPVLTSFRFADRIGGTPTAPVIFPGGYFLGGSFRRIFETPALRAGAVNSNNGGPLTAADNPAAFTPSVNDDVLASVLQNGTVRTVIGGRFTSVGGRLVSRIARLDAAGAPDATYNIGSGADGDVLALAVNASNQVYAGGQFLSFNSLLFSRIVRLNVDGDVDPAFSVGTGFNATVRALQTTDANGTPLANNQVFVAGDFTAYNGAAAGGIIRLNPNGTRDSSFNPGTGANGPIYAIKVQSDGSVIIGGDFTSFNGVARNRVARLTAAGAVDAAFDPGTGANALVTALAVNPTTGTVYVGGAFTSFNNTVRVGFLRLTSAGALDTAFNNASGFGVGFTNQEVTSLATTSNGKVIVGGNFGSVTGRPRNFVERLNANGTPDPTFQPNRGPDNIVTALFAQPQTNPPNGTDDNIIIAGQFTNVDNGTTAQAVSGLARLLANGTLDTTFTPTVDGQVNAFAGVANGGFVIAGDFRNVGGATRGGVARLTAAGALDPSFNPGVGFGGGVDAIALQADGRLLAGGRFTAFNGPNGGTVPYVARLATDGSLDRSFLAQPDARVEAIAVQVNGTILIGGAFANVEGNVRNGLARLGLNGRLDPAFNPNLNAGAEVLTITIQPDSRLLITGNFSTVNGVNRRNVARLNVDGTLDPTFGSSDATAGTNGMVEALVRKTSGAVLIGGTFTSVDGQPRARLAQLQGDQPPTTLQFSASVFNVNQVEGTATITVTRAGSPAGSVGVSYATSDGTAISGVNYTTVSGTLFWADGDGSPKTFTVPIRAVTNTGATTVFTVNLTLSNPTGDATIGNPGTAVLNITAESLSTIQFTATTFAARESDPTATISVVRGASSLGATVTVNYATSDTTGGANVRYTPVSGTLTFGPGETGPKTFTVPIIDNNVRDGDQVVQITLSATTGFAVLGSPSVANLIIVDDETPPVGANASFSGSSYSVREDAGSVAIVINRTDAGSGRVAVSYATADGSANAAGRYQPTTGTVIFENGDLSPKIVRIPIINNALRDGDATVLLTLTSTSGGNPVPGGTATLTIVDDDAAPASLPTTFQFTAPTFSAFEGDGSATITVTRAGGPSATLSASSGTVSVRYTITDITARLGVNYANTLANPNTGILTWSANDFTPKTFNVTLVRDNLAPGNLSVGLALTSPQSLLDINGNTLIPASLGNPNQATLTVVDVDLPAVLQFTQDLYQTYEDSGAAVVTVIRTGGMGTAVAVNYSVGGGSAAVGSRYSATNGTLSWPAGDTSPRTIVIPILQDNVTEPDQTVGLALGTLQGNAILGPQATSTLLITDDDGGQFFPVLSVDAPAPAQATTDGVRKGFFFITRRNRFAEATNTDLPLTVSYRVAGTALNGQEYRFLSGTAVIPAGEDFVKIKVKAINNGGDHQSSVKVTLNGMPNSYYINSGAMKAKVKIVFPENATP